MKENNKNNTGKTPSVMIVVPALEVTGPSKGIFQQLHFYKNKPGDFSLFNFRLDEKLEDDPFLTEGNKNGINVNFYKQNKRFDFTILKAAEKEARSRKINVFQSHGYKPGIIGCYLKWKLGIKWICFMHGKVVHDFKLKMYIALDNLIQLYADKVILVCEEHRKNIIGGNNKSRVTVINNAIDTENPAEITKSKKFIRASLGFNDNDKIAVCVSRYSYEKGLDVFVKAFKKIIQVVPNSYGVIVGDGPKWKEIINLISTEKLGDRIKVVGYSKYPGNFMQIADVLVLSSRSEGLPNVILEAMALGIPVVATKVGGVEEIVENDISGLVVPKENPEEIGKAVIKILSDKKLSRRLRDNALNEMKERFECNIRSEKIYQIYLELLSEKHRLEKIK